MRANISQTGKITEAGFSLLEVLITIAILGVLATASAYPVRTWQSRTTLLAVLAHFDGAVSTAGSEAIRTGLPQSILFRSNAFEVMTNRKRHLYPLPTGVNYRIKSALELETNGYPTITFFEDGTNSGAVVTFSDGAQSETRALSWIGTVDDDPQ